MAFPGGPATPDTAWYDRIVYPRQIPTGSLPGGSVTGSRLAAGLSQAPHRRGRCYWSERVLLELSDTVTGAETDNDLVYYDGHVALASANGDSLRH
jgi:hypothetical protein